ncbi:MAG: S24 family peptidase, partial [Oscillospiraceae bacterium]|nr:S24 family peptidase [Oscillospiraceae bacterium]
SGDSMEPVYQDGQIIWIQETQDLRVGEEGIFIYDGQAYFKVLTERVVSNGGDDIHVPVLRSYNEKYAPKEVRTQLGFKVVGRVL